MEERGTDVRMEGGRKKNRLPEWGGGGGASRGGLTNRLHQVHVVHKVPLPKVDGQLEAEHNHQVGQSESESESALLAKFVRAKQGS